MVVDECLGWPAAHILEHLHGRTVANVLVPALELLSEHLNRFRLELSERFPTRLFDARPSRSSTELRPVGLSELAPAFVHSGNLREVPRRVRTSHTFVLAGKADAEGGDIRNREKTEKLRFASYASGRQPGFGFWPKPGL